MAEKAEKATVTIFDLTSTNLKKKRPLSCQECLSRECVPVAWASDSAWLFTEGTNGGATYSCHLAYSMQHANCTWHSPYDMLRQWINRPGTCRSHSPPTLSI